MPSATGLPSTPPVSRRVLLVSAASGTDTRSAPLGAAQIAAWLYKQAELRGAFSFELVQAQPDESPERLADRLLSEHPALVGFSLYAWNSSRLLATARLLRKLAPSLLLLGGGPECAATAEALLEGTGLDYLVRGEGEAGAKAFFSAWLAGTLPERTCPPADRIFGGELADLTKLPSPWLDGIISPEGGGSVVWELTRGCPYRCAFCYESRGSGKVRKLSEERLEKELRLFAKRGVRQIFVLDPVFNADFRRMQRLVQLMRRLGPAIHYQLELRAELLTAEQARLLSGLDCQVQLGLQSTNTAALAHLNRHFNQEKFRTAIRLLEEEGIIYGLDLIYGLPEDSLADFKRSLGFALEQRPNHLDIFPLAVLPGTALWSKAEDLGLDHENSAPYRVTRTSSCTAGELAVMAKLAAAADLLYNRGRAVMWYLPLCQALGLNPVDPLEGFEPGAVERGGMEQRSHRDIETVQLAWLEKLLQDQGLAAQDELGLLLCELVRTSGAWTRVLAEGEETILDLHWSPEDLLDVATMDCLEALDSCDQIPGRWSCRQGREGPEFRKIGKREGSRGKEDSQKR